MHPRFRQFRVLLHSKKVLVVISPWSLHIICSYGFPPTPKDVKISVYLLPVLSFCMFQYLFVSPSVRLSTGTYAVMSVMIGSVTERLAPDSNFIILDNVTNQSTGIVDTIARNDERVRVAAAVTFLSGLFQVNMLKH